MLLFICFYEFQGLAITFISDENDSKILNDVQKRFDVNIKPLPDEIDLSSYSKWLKIQFFLFPVAHAGRNSVADLSTTMPPILLVDVS